MWYRSSDLNDAPGHLRTIELWERAEGSPAPLGATWVESEQAWNFACYSRHATGVTLLLYGEEDLATPAHQVGLEPRQNKTGRIWHCFVPEGIVYELHVKGFTARANSGVAPENRGTFLGLIRKVPYLKELGVTIVELRPVHQFDPQEGNYWGYMTLNFFAPHRGYAVRDGVDEFRALMKAFHEEVLALRRQQAKNFCCLLMLASGLPMFHAGDEFLHTRAATTTLTTRITRSPGWIGPARPKS